MTFQLDTSGFVLPVERYDPKWNAEPAGYRWSDLSPFTQGYVEALFASAGDDAAFRSQWMLRDVVNDTPEADWRNTPPAFSDLAPEALARIIADCEAACAPIGGTDKSTAAQGRRYWNARQGGGTLYPTPLTVQLGDDGKVRFAP